MLESTLRPYWVRGINEITGRQSFSLTEFLDFKKGYVFYDSIQTTSFAPTIIDYVALLKGYAFDINRFGCASIESINSIYYKPEFPKAHAWSCIKAYYSAYYAAHGILRMMGVSCTTFDRNVLGSIETIADLYGKKGAISIEKGYYKCSINNNKLECSKIITSGNKGSHEQLWLIYLQLIEILLLELVKETPTIEIQSTISKLSDLKANLTYSGSTDGNWLSKVRNEINYRHTNGLWYPYNKAARYFEKIERTANYWSNNPESIEISIYTAEPILRFLSTCIFITSLYVVLAKDMSNRCPKGKSFHINGVLAMINQIN